MVEVRVSPDGVVAQTIPEEVVRARADREARWIAVSWPNGVMTMTLLADEDVADWHVVHRG